MAMSGLLVDLLTIRVSICNARFKPLKAFSFNRFARPRPGAARGPTRLKRAATAPETSAPLRQPVH